MILRPSYLHNGISYTGKMTSLYWIRAQATPSYILAPTRRQAISNHADTSVTAGYATHIKSYHATYILH